MNLNTSKFGFDYSSEAHSKSSDKFLFRMLRLMAVLMRYWASFWSNLSSFTVCFENSDTWRFEAGPLLSSISSLKIKSSLDLTEAWFVDEDLLLLKD